MLSKYSFYEFRPVEKTDLFSDDGCIGFAYPILIRTLGDNIKVSCVCKTRHPWLGSLVQIFKWYHRCKSKLLLTHREYGF